MENQATNNTNSDPVAGKSVAEIFGEIVWLMSQDAACRDLTLKELEWLVMPAILLRQFHITYAPVQGNAHGDAGHGESHAAGESPLQPVAVEIFALCSEAVADAIDAAKPGAPRLGIQDWRSGSNRKTVIKANIVGAAGKQS
ncbi:toxin-activating lysine-acyltransferase (plasmid) [Martelella lutilitoris]|uniref:RTX toxin-activating lysine-acyltransferase n=1 Tax=Martelella lutilitoris TaxID=2583532 RepID=A0A7T7KNR4_9HYPH|nr:toxin-activating lysine-acyltransferase [Martelella lutilitoris]QQM33126.1 toxin-activating lysine-acyltransferase [Martelella lutilitoris]